MPAKIYRELPSYKRQGGFKRFLKTMASLLFLVFVALTVVEGNFLRAQKVESESMRPGIVPGDTILVSPLLFGKESLFADGTYFDFAGPGYGDIVLLKPPFHKDLSFFEKLADIGLRFVTLGHKSYYPRSESIQAWESASVPRRVIALAGDEVYFSGGVFYVKKKGETNFQNEFVLSGKKYGVLMPDPLELDPGHFLADQTSVVKVPESSYFVAADNRRGFLDSRHWGSVDSSKFRGKVLLKIWPFPSFGQVN